MSSGSTYLGQVLGFRNDTFYFYEPLWYFGLWKFYESPDKECDVRGSLTCRKITSAQLNDNKHTSKDLKHRSGDTYFGRDDFTVVDINKFYQTNVRYEAPTDLLIDVLTDIYRCDLRRLTNLVVSHVHPLHQYGGPSWETYRTCITKEPNSKGNCLKRLEQKCKSADHVVTKVLRITSGSLETLLERFDNLKVLHLYRDPRAVVNSRMKWPNYPIGNVFQNARILCDKMLVDLLGGIKIAEKFRNRLRFIFYEDILLETTEKVTLLFDFLGMQHITANTKTNVRNDQSLVLSEYQEDLQDLARKENNAFWWRHNLSYDTVNLIHSQCRDITVIFNMTHFKNATSLQNMSTPSIVLPEFFRLIQ